MTTLRHTPKGLDRLMKEVRSAAPDGLENLIRLGLPLLSAEDANELVVKLVCENMRLWSILDAAAMREGRNA